MPDYDTLSEEHELLIPHNDLTDNTEDVKPLKGKEIGNPPLWILFLVFFIAIWNSCRLFSQFSWIRDYDTKALSTELYRPNMYIGLDSVNRTSSLLALPDHLDVFPHTFAPIDRTAPDYVFPSDGRARLTFNGLVSPGEPHIILNKSVSMIAQIRVQDHNLEQCAIASFIPLHNELQDAKRTLSIYPEQLKLNIWELDSSNGEIDQKNLSWLTAPRRTRFLTTLLVEHGASHESSEFYCGSSTSLLTLEIACPDQEQCELDFWQEQPEVHPRMGE